MSLATLESANGHIFHDEPSPPRSRRFSLGEMQVMAEVAVDSRLFPNLNSVPAVLSLMLICDAEGIHPMQALKKYHIVDNKPSMRAEAMLADFQVHGGRLRWDRTDAKACTATFFHPTHAPEGVALTWTIEQAKDAGLTGKGVWKSYPDAMLRARVISAGIRMVMPGIVTGIYTPEEVESFDDRGTGWSTPLPSKPPQNASGHASGAYASPAQVAAYVEWMSGYVDAGNAAWVDTLASLLKRAGLDAAEGLKQQVFNRFQLSAHLVKFFGEAGVINLDERGSQNGDKPDKLGALVFERDPDAVSAEADAYYQRCHAGERARAIIVIKAALDASKVDAKGRGQLRTEDVDAASLDDDDALYPTDPTEGT